MATIANLTLKADGSYEGNLATLSVTAPIAIVPNGRKSKDSEPVVTLPGSPPKAAIFARTHFSAATRSSIPTLPEWRYRSSPTSDKSRKPNGPSL